MIIQRKTCDEPFGFALQSYVVESRADGSQKRYVLGVLEERISLFPDFLNLIIIEHQNIYWCFYPLSYTYIDRVREGGIAAKAGLRNGDVLIAVNGTMVVAERHSALVALLRKQLYARLVVIARNAARYTHSIESPFLSSVGFVFSLSSFF